MLSRLNRSQRRARSAAVSASSLLAPATKGDSMRVTVLDQSLVDLGPEIAADLPSALRREWPSTYVRYTLLRGSGPLQLELSPLVTYRDFHTLSRGDGWTPGFVDVPNGIEVRAFEGAQPFQILNTSATFIHRPAWYFNFLHREERSRGLDDTSDLFVPGEFTAGLQPGQSVTFMLTAEREPDLAAERARR